MLSYEPNLDAEMMRLWGIVAELSEQLTQIAGSLIVRGVAAGGSVARLLLKRRTVNHLTREDHKVKL